MIPHSLISAFGISAFSVLAELPTPAANELAAWLICAVCVVLGINAVLKLTDRFKSKEAEPPNAQLKHDQTTLMRRVNALELDVKHGFERQSENDTRQRGLLYDKIDETRTELQGQIENVRKELSDNLGSMPSQIIAILRNTGSIGGKQ